MTLYPLTRSTEVDQRTQFDPSAADSPSGLLEMPRNRPTQDEIDAFFRNPLSLPRKRLALVQEFVKRQYAGHARNEYLRHQKKISP